MKRVITKYALALVAVASLGSCSKWLDVNENPLTASKVDPRYLFSYATIATSGCRQSGDLFIPTAIGSQLIADGGFVDWGGGWGSARYDFNVYAGSNNWAILYSDGLNQLTLATKYARERGELNSAAQSEIFQAYLFYTVTMLFGDVPCSEALQNPEKLGTPKFDSQKAVLENCIALLDDAISIADPKAEGAITNYDIFYKGNMTKWIHAARSLKLQVLLTLYNREPARAADIATLVGAAGFVEQGADLAFPYFTQAGTENPNWRLTNRYSSDLIDNPDPAKRKNSSYLFFAHNSVLKPMQANNDPRIPIYFLANVEGKYRGLDTSIPAEKLPAPAEGTHYLSSPINVRTFYTPTMPDVWMSYQETQFNLAEIYLRGIGVAADAAKAQTAYENAVKASCKFWKVAEADITTFVAGLPKLADMSQDEALKAINTQRWIDMMSRPVEAFNNQRRTGIPALTTPKAANYPGELFQRYEYPPREYGGNPNVPSPRPKFYERTWFNSTK